MAIATSCVFVKPDGERCRSSPMRESGFCFWHDPDHRDEATEARRLGGLRRRREKITSGAYELEGVESIEEIRRIVQIAVLDALGLENSVARARTLLYAAQTALRLNEVTEVEERLEALEAALEAPRRREIMRRRRIR